jgi:signal peptidase II
MKSFWVIAMWAAILDGLSKWWALRYAPFIVFNTEIGRYYLSDATVSFVTVSIMFALVYTVYRGKTLVPILPVPAGIMFGGAVGNAVSRYTGPAGVLDFIPFGGYSLGNLADIWIIGGGLATWSVVSWAVGVNRVLERPR